MKGEGRSQAIERERGTPHRFVVASVVLDDPGTLGTAARVEGCIDGDPGCRIALYLTRHGGVMLQNLAGWRIENDVERLGYPLAAAAGSVLTRWWTEPRAQRLVESWVAYVRAHAAAIYALGARPRAREPALSRVAARP